MLVLQCKCMMNTFSSRRRHAFTLIEILVVIAIIAVLIAILLPALAQAKVRARRTVCMSQMRQIGVALTTYAHTHDNWLPPVWNYGISWVNYVPHTVDPLVVTALTAEQGLTAQVLICPSLQKPGLFGLFPATALVKARYQTGYAFLTGYYNHGLAIAHPVDPLFVESSASRLTDDGNKVMAADINVRLGLVWTANWANDWTSHIEGVPFRPAGGHSLFTDGRVSWTTAQRLGPTHGGIDLRGNYGWQALRDVYWGID